MEGDELLEVISSNFCKLRQLEHLINYKNFYFDLYLSEFANQQTIESGYLSLQSDIA